MIRHANRSSLAIVLLAASFVPSARAELIGAGTTDLTGTAIMDLTLLPGTPFNPGTVPFTLQGVSGYGTITLNRDAETPNLTINIPTLAGGMFYGSDPNLGSYVFGNIAPLTGADFSGSITNVVQDPSDPGFATGQASSFRSGDFSFGGASFGFEFLSPGPFQFLKLFTDPVVPFSFASTFDGLPPSQGTVLRNSGPDSLNVLAPDGSVVATTSNRRIVLTAVPEPTSLGLIVAGALLGVGRARRRGRPLG